MISLKNTCIALSLIMSTASFAAVSYSPDQLAQFELTNQCNNCDLSGATLWGNHSGAVLATTNLTGVHASGTFAYANFSGSNLSSSNWEIVNLSNAQLAYIPLINANFFAANLSYANFEGANTQYANFGFANLYGSNISQQQLDNSVNYCGAILPSGARKNC